MAAAIKYAQTILICTRVSVVSQLEHWFCEYCRHKCVGLVVLCLYLDEIAFTLRRLVQYKTVSCVFVTDVDFIIYRAHYFYVRYKYDIILYFQFCALFTCLSLRSNKVIVLG